MEGLNVQVFQSGDVWNTVRVADHVRSVAEGQGSEKGRHYMQDYVLVASNGAIVSTDEHLQQFKELCRATSCQCTVYWQPRHAVNKNIQAVGEEVSFIPHPKTMTMAGEWEYFAAGSQHPFPYAVAELIDNSLRATKGNQTSRRIVVSLVAGSVSSMRPSTGYVSVWDNGCGMSMRQLNDWAVMNLTMEDRGQQPKEVAMARHEQGSAAAKQLHSDLSYFGVGSKNAAFFMGRCIKVTTKSPENLLVHEMEISADSLEERYQVSPDQVYKERIHKRMLGDATAACSQTILQQWIQEEATTDSQSGESDSFTRVTVSNLKQDILKQFTVEEGANVCRQLAHMYHYYLHGAQGRTAEGTVDEENRQHNSQEADKTRLPTGDLVPQIVVQLCTESEVLWSIDLLDVQDDLESQYLAARASTFPFTLEVRGKGSVEGALWYFPFKDDRETVPVAVNQFIKQAQKESGIGTQLTQALTQATQNAQAQNEVIEIDSADELEELHGEHPIFEVFWQGRLIPGTSVSSVPFIDELRVKMLTSGWKEDGVPDECFKRLRGALFVGPSWSVTRNKLKLRDNLDTLLANAMGADRMLDKNFRQWIGQCHRDLDKTCMYQELMPAEDMRQLRNLFGHSTTFFKHVTDGSRTIEQGSIVLCEKQNYTVAEVHCVGVSRVHETSTQAAGGFAILSPMPAVMWSPDTLFKLSLRRISLPSPEALTAALQKEQAKLPRRLEVLRKDPGKVVQLDAGRKLGELTLEAMNEEGKRLTSRTVTVRGKKVPLTLCRMVLQFNTPDAGWPDDPAALLQSSTKGAGRSGSGSGKRGKGKKGKGGASSGASEDAQVATPDDVVVDGTAKLFVEEISSTRGATFELKAIQEPFKNAGRYGVLCMLHPVMDRERPVVHMMEVVVSAGQPEAIEVGGPGAEMLQSCLLHLGQRVRALDLLLKDNLGNVNQQVVVDSDVHVTLLNAGVSGVAGEDSPAPEDLALQCEVCKDAESGVQLRNLSVQGKPGMATESGLPSFSEYCQGFLQGCTMSQIPALDAMALPMVLRIKVNTLSTDLAVKLLPGVPVKPVLVGDDPFLTGPVCEEHHALALEGGVPVPVFSVRAQDQYGNVCIPSPALTWSISTESAGISPNPALASPDTAGVATLLNAQISRNVAKDEDWTVPVCISVTPTATDAAEGMDEIIQAAGDAQSKLEGMKLLLAPSTGPHSLAMCVGDHDIEFEDSPETGKRVFNLGEVAAGSCVEEISFTASDEGGRPVAAGVSGKVMCGWMRKARTAKFAEEGTLVLLPKLPVTTEIGQRQYDMRFWNAGEHGFDIEAVLLVTVVPAAPALWQIWPIEGDDSCIEVQEQDQGWTVVCGNQFTVALELVDEFGNKCPKHDVEPTVNVLDGVEGAVCRLASPGSTLKAAWEVMQDDEMDSKAHFYCCRMVLCGEEGQVEVVVPPVTIPGEALILLPELRQALTILPGPPTKLKMDVQIAVQYGAKGTLGDVTVHTVDCSGNVSVPEKNYEVTLKPAALSPDDPSVSAKVAATGSNRTRMQNGRATFKNVHLKSDSQGLFQLVVYCKSSSVALEEATATVELRPCNAVTAVVMDAASVPLTPVPAGNEMSVVVDLETEDKSPVPLADALKGLTLQLMAPGAKSRAAQVLRADEDATEPIITQGKVSFNMGAMTSAGQYTLVAEWREHRAGLPQVDARSPASTITVSPGQPADAQISLANDSITLLASNGSSASTRLALKQLHVQLMDIHGNFTSSGCPAECRVVLHWQESVEPSWGGCELPHLVSCAGSEPQKPLDMCGAVCFGDILVQERSGRIIPDPDAGEGAPAALNLCIKVQLQGVVFDGDAMDVDQEGWSTIWEKELLFSDDANHIAKIVEYSQAQRKHAAKAQEVATRSAELRASVQEAQSNLSSAEIQLQHLTATALPHTPALSAEDLCNADAIRGRLAELAAAKVLAATGSAASQQSGPENVGRKARYGHPQQAQTAAVKHVVDAQPAGMLGPLAELGSVNDTRLSELLSAHLWTSLRTLVVESTESRVTITRMLREAQKEIPDILSLNISNRCNMQQPRLRKDVGSLPPNVRKLVMSACQSSEAPLAVPLPHASLIANLERQKKPAPDIPFGKLDWPPGCIDYIVNLIRPCALPSVQDLRATVFWTLMSRTLLFETLQQAEAYREAVLRAGGSCPDIITLDGSRLRGNGVVTGSSFSVQPLSKAPFRFSQLPATQNLVHVAHEQEEASLQKVLEAVIELERCTEALQAAEQAANLHSSEHAEDVDRINREVGELDNEIKRGTKRRRADCAIVASQPRRNRKKKRAAAVAQALDAAGLEDEDA